jgi:spoIIIJ-associated protein
MNSITMTAKTVEEAVELGLRELGVDRTEAEIEVVSRGKPGLLGIGSEPAKIKVTKIDNPSEVVQVASDVVSKLIRMMDIDVISTMRHTDGDDEGPFFDIEGEDSALLIGRRGETLRALQLLVRTIVGRKLGTNVNFSVDVEGYDDRRRQSLANLADRVASRVIKTGRSIELEPMSARERRIVHISLADQKGIQTESSGEGKDRRVVIQPSQ